MPVHNDEVSESVPQAGPFTCSVLSADEPLPGTAAQVAGWVCVEYPGAWGRDVLDGTALGPELAAALTDRADAAGVRIMFIRRPGRTEDRGTRTVLLANSHPDDAWCERLEIGAVADLLDIDLTRIAGPAPGLGERVDGPSATSAARSWGVRSRRRSQRSSPATCVSARTPAATASRRR